MSELRDVLDVNLTSKSERDKVRQELEELMSYLDGIIVNERVKADSPVYLAAQVASRALHVLQKLLAKKKNLERGEE